MGKLFSHFLAEIGCLSVPALSFCFHWRCLMLSSFVSSLHPPLCTGFVLWAASSSIKAGSGWTGSLFPPWAFIYKTGGFAFVCGIGSRSQFAITIIPVQNVAAPMTFTEIIGWVVVLHNDNKNSKKWPASTFTSCLQQLQGREQEKATYTVDSA